MKRFWTILFAALLLVAFTAPAFAWEFSMKGEWEHRYRKFWRAGDTDLFGVAPAQEFPIANNAGLALNIPNGTAQSAGLGEPNFVGFAGPRTYNRGAVGAENLDSSGPLSNGGTALGTAGVPGPSQNLITRGGFSRYGSDAWLNETRLTLYPEIRVNNAIRVHGVYNVGGYRNKYFMAAGSLDPSGPGTNVGSTGVGVPPFERYYSSQTSMNAYDTAAIGSWEQFRATIQMPIGILSLGIKDFPFGTGATLGNNTRAEAFLTVVPYGPFRILHGLWIARSRFFESWDTMSDGEMKNWFFQGGLLTYDAADLSAGVGAIWRNYHGNRGAGGALGGNSALALAGNFTAGSSALVNGVPVGVPDASQIKGVDENDSFYLAYFKYFNGRFFANAEYAWTTIDRYRIGVQPLVIAQATTQPLNVLNALPSYLEGYHFFAELGTVCGPAKLSLAYALASGRVLNNNNITKTYVPWTMNYQAMEPYQYLMFDTYAGGNNGGWSPVDVSFVADEHGCMTDAFSYAARLDYAVASNLNVWGSYIWAHRLEKAGFYKGGILSSGAAASAASRQLFVAQNFGAASGEVGGPINPYVDDGYLGWEGGAGVDWKLLEGLTWSSRYSYWQPGDWFTQAYQAVGFAPGNGAFVNNAVVSGRAPIQAFTSTLLINF